MRLRLSDGTIINSLAAPSKRQVKYKGGSLKRWHSRTSGTNVGGTTNTARATYKNFEVCPDTGEVVINRVFPPLTCITVDASKKRFTTDLGGSCSTGYIGGKGI